jgi:hypothetical protein
MASWKAPGRPEHKITQSYNDGMLTVYAVSDEAAPGRQPVRRLAELVKLPYETRRVGIQRYYAAAQNQTKVQRVLRVPHSGKPVTNRCLADTEDGSRYRIDLVQSVPDVYPPSDDLTLVVYEQGGADG